MASDRGAYQLPKLRLPTTLIEPPAEEETRARVGGASRCDESIYSDPEWSGLTEALASATFARGQTKRAAEAVAADVVSQVKRGKTLADITTTIPRKTEEQRGVYRVCLEEAGRILKAKLGNAATPRLKEATDAAKIASGEPVPDAKLVSWAHSMLEDIERWKKKPKNSKE